MTQTIKTALTLVGIALATMAQAKVRLLDSRFKQAQDLNVQVLLQYDTDRLLAPYLREAGLEPKGESYPNWIGLDGHVGGHYLTALSLAWRATGNQECLDRANYMVSELARCAKANGDGYAGGVPDSRELWTRLRAGEVELVWKWWVPWYNVHKTLAGLRDAWLYTGNRTARRLFLDFADWTVSEIAPLSDEQMESMVQNEFGGMNEVLADAYEMTGKQKYLTAARRFAHHRLLDAMAAGIDNLDNQHANTQVPKVVGYQRIAEMTGDAEYDRAARFFWDRVVNHRSLSFGGNSRREHFVSAEDANSYVDDREGPETCNTNNMLKLTEGLHRMTPTVDLADYYERALFNHLLSAVHPQHGGYVYFTPARPAHYRVYSQPNQAMWCCVGTGMENPEKYGEFIYSQRADSLLVNLFVASQLEWGKVKVTQQTQFPYEEGARLTVNTRKPTRFKMLVRCPGWMQPGAMRAVVDGHDYAQGAQPGQYIVIDRKWTDGDQVELSLPMTWRLEEVPGVPQYVSIMRGPILMGASMGASNVTGLLADDGRWSHIAQGPLVSLFDTPFLIGDRDSVTAQLNSLIPSSPMHYRAPGLLPDSVTLEPFADIHDVRYMICWISMPKSKHTEFVTLHREEERQRLMLDSLTVDGVNTGEQQPEVDHQMVAVGSQKGNFGNEPYRNARDGGYFEYTLNTLGLTDLMLMVRYWGNESGPRQFQITIDGQPLATESLTGKWNAQSFVNVDYPIPAEMLRGKETVTVRFQSLEGQIAGSVFHLRLRRPF